MDNLNKQNLERSKKILLNIANFPKNSKFHKLSKQELERAKILRTENTITEQKFFRYKRGTIVFIHFGTNIGNEFSNSHFGIVLDKKDHPANGNLTILPLTSKSGKNNISIGKAVFSEIMKNEEKQIQQIKEILNITETLKRIHFSLPEPPRAFSPTPEGKNYDLWMNYYNRHDPHGKHVPVANLTIRQWIQSDLDKINYLKDLYSNYNKVSYVKIDSITSISKFKIAKPINDLDPIGKITVSKEIMDEIDIAIAKRLLAGKWTKLDN